MAARRRAGVQARVRARLRAQGLRPVLIWVPDVRSEEFAAEAHRQSAAVAASARAREDQAFIDATCVVEQAGCPTRTWCG